MRNGMNKIEKHRKFRAKMIFKVIMVMIGGIIAAYGLETVLIPNSVSDGGVTGLSIVGSQLFDLPLGILIAVLNIPFVWLGYKQIGKSFALLSIIGIASLAAGTGFMHHTPAIIEGDTLLVTVVGGSSLDLEWGWRSAMAEHWTELICLLFCYRENCHLERAILFYSLTFLCLFLFPLYLACRGHCCQSLPTTSRPKSFMLSRKG